MRVVCISDTHTYHEKVKLPKGDVLIHAGDISILGGIEEIFCFNEWLGTLDFEHKIVIAGNHDFLFQKNYGLAKSLMTNCIYLQDEEIIIDGIKFYGSPWQPEFYNWAFNVPRGKESAKIWSRIPNDTNILITHGPPYGILDKVLHSGSVGCEDLLKRIQSLSLKLHVFGHIHEGYGKRLINKTLFVNASICNKKHKMENKPMVVEI